MYMWSCTCINGRYLCSVTAPAVEASKGGRLLATMIPSS